MTANQVTELLLRWRQGDSEALQALIPLVYEDLRRIAERHLRQERSEHTLQSTALVHEAYLRIVKQQVPFAANDRSHFIALASRLMRQILVDYSRGHRAAKRGADRRVTLDTGVVIANSQTVDVVDLHDALNELAQIDEKQSRIVELRFFGGLSTEETAEVLNISPATVKRDWAVAKSWLTRQMKKGSRANA